jgi:hypothetical protein
MTAKIEGNNLVLHLPLQDPRPSSTGKTLIVAGGGGAMTTAAVVNGKAVIVTVTAYIKP